MFTLAPKSNKALSMMVFPMTQEIIGDSGSLYLTGMWLDKYELTLAAKTAFLEMLVVFFFGVVVSKIGCVYGLSIGDCLR